MKQITLSQVENAFLPAKEISNPEKFSGRAPFIKGSYLALISEGANIAIVGNRGIGKSSLAGQIINLSQGNNILLEKLGLPSDEKLDYLSIYFACGKTINNIQVLLERLLTTRDCLLEWIYEIPSASKELSKIDGRLNVGIAKIVK